MPICQRSQATRAQRSARTGSFNPNEPHGLRLSCSAPASHCTVAGIQLPPEFGCAFQGERLRSGRADLLLAFCIYEFGFKICSTRLLDGVKGNSYLLENLRVAKLSEDANFQIRRHVPQKRLGRRAGAPSGRHGGAPTGIASVGSPLAGKLSNCLLEPLFGDASWFIPGFHVPGVRRIPRHVKRAALTLHGVDAGLGSSQGSDHHLAPLDRAAWDAAGALRVLQ